MHNRALDEAVTAIGGVEKAARKIGVTRQGLYYMLGRGSVRDTAIASRLIAAARDAGYTVTLEALAAVPATAKGSASRKAAT